MLGHLPDLVRTSRGKVFATQYIGYTRYEVAAQGLEVGKRLQRTHPPRRSPHRGIGKRVGPWNIKDKYWQSHKNGDRWNNLSRCAPDAEAAYFDNYNHGEDQFGREVLNPAGVDLRLRVACRLGLGKY